ncbi:hypothetical protein HOC80_00475 [archaeon]|jgi:hypothetical protein|nr:hypothetical protein [archaeon]MBT4416560.1 hypothetical protein [archaeon]
MGTPNDECQTWLHEQIGRSVDNDIEYRMDRREVHIGDVQVFHDLAQALEVNDLVTIGSKPGFKYKVPHADSPREWGFRMNNPMTFYMSEHSANYTLDGESLAE